MKEEGTSPGWHCLDAQSRQRQHRKRKTKTNIPRVQAQNKLFSCDFMGSSADFWWRAVFVEFPDFKNEHGYARCVPSGKCTAWLHFTVHKERGRFPLPIYFIIYDSTSFPVDEEAQRGGATCPKPHRFWPELDFDPDLSDSKVMLIQQSKVFT